MTSNMTSNVLFTEIFPVKLEKIQKLTVYKPILTNNQSLQMVGGKLSYRLRKRFNGHWVCTSEHILTDCQVSQEDINKLLSNLWSEDSGTYGCVSRVEQVNWEISAQAKADFFAKGLFEDLGSTILVLLKKESVTQGDIVVKRMHEVRGWVVGESPSVSISISSNIIYKYDLSAYIKQRGEESIPNNLWVTDKTSTMKGCIIRISGNLSEHRERLIRITQREEMKEIIKNADENEKVLLISSGQSQYEYVASALNIVVTTENLRYFGINSKEFYQSSLLSLEKRVEIIKAISRIAKEKGFIGDAYNSISQTNFFVTKEIIGFNPRINFGRNRKEEYNERSLFQGISKFGLYRPSQNNAIKIGIIFSSNLLKDKTFENFKENLVQKISVLGFTASVVKEIALTNMYDRVILENAVNKLQPETDIILAIFPDETTDEDNDEGSAYYNLKSLTINQGIPSQVVYESTMKENYAIPNIVLGLIGKTGSIPFVLDDNQIKYADLIVGIDIARRRKERLKGSMNAAATARIYLNNGEFLRYSIHDAQLEGETIPENVLQSLFPSKDFKGKKAIIHRDGYFRGDEKESLKKWANEISAEFFLVEIIKTGTPRLYMTNQNKKILQPSKGSLFKISDTEGFLVSSLPPSPKVTPQPLRIRTELPLSVEQAAHSILCMTLLHYGSLRPPRLPVTIHYSDRIAHLALQGIKPKNLEGNVPFWL